MIIPDLTYEQQLWKKGLQFVAGIDEVGRGALAGPVVTAAVIVDQNHVPIVGIRDSKTLSKKQKLSLNQQILDTCTWGIGEASAQEIDEVGIVPATILAMQRALSSLPKTQHLLIDGLPFKDKKALNQHQKTFIVKGDSLSYSIAAASIIAKVYRDAIMEQLGLTHTGYGFEKNVGYGTKYHLYALKLKKPTNFHRKSFLRKLSTK